MDKTKLSKRKNVHNLNYVFKKLVFYLGDKYTKICTLFDIPCYVDAVDEFSKNLLLKNCDCLPDCTSITYDLELSQAPYDFLRRNSYKD